MAIKILHLTYDNVFSARMVNDFEKVSKNNNYLIVPAREGAPKHFNGLKNLSTPSTDSEIERELSRHLEFCNLIIIHYMHEDWAKFLAKADTKNLIILWSGFGGDYYGSAFDGYSNLLGRQTKHVLRKIKEPENLKLWLYRKNRLLKFEQATQKLVKKIDYFSAPVPNDFEVFKKRFRGFKGQFHHLKYAKTQDFKILEAPSARKNILVGNSATPENNHLEVFKLIQKSDLEFEKIIVPLSYGAVGSYRDEVLSAGADAFGEAFLPLTNFMDLGDYNALIASCNIAIMGHLRQQALGNLLTLLVSGSNVFLHESNPILSYFKDIGVKVEGVSFDRNSNSIAGPYLKPADIERNQKIVNELWGEEEVIGAVETLLKKVSKKIS